MKKTHCMNFLIYGIEIVLGIILVYYIFSCCIYQLEHPTFKITFLSIILILTMLFIIYKLINNKNFKYYNLLIFIFSFLIYAVWGIYAKTEPVSDYEVLIKIKIISFDKTNYFYFYNFQTGFVMYLALVIKIFGSHLIFLKIFEILFMSLTNVFVYKIASKVYTKKIGIISSIIYSLLFFNIAGSSIINNQHFSTLLIILSIYFFIKDKWFYYILSGTLVGIANIIRPSSIIILIAFCGFLLWKLLINNFKNWKVFLLGFLLIALSTFSTMKIFDYTLLNLNIVPTSTLSSNAKYFKFVLGIHGNGIYNIPTETAEKTQVYFDLQKLNFDYDLYNNECKNFIVNKFTQNTKETFGHIKNKMLVFCGEEDNQIGFSGNKVQNSKSYIFIKYYGYVQYFLLIVFSLLTVIINVKESKFYNTKNKV